MNYSEFLPALQDVFLQQLLVAELQQLHSWHQSLVLRLSDQHQNKYNNLNVDYIYYSTIYPTSARCFNCKIDDCNSACDAAHCSSYRCICCNVVRCASLNCCSLVRNSSRSCDIYTSKSAVEFLSCSHDYSNNTV